MGLGGELRLWGELGWWLLESLLNIDWGSGGERLLLLLLRELLLRRRQLGEVGQAVDVYAVGPLVRLVPYINALLTGNQINQLIAVLANYNRPEVTGHVVPSYAVTVIIVKHSETSLVVELLEPLHGDANVVVGLYRSFLESFVVIRLRDSSFSSSTPKCLWVGLISGRYSAIESSGPEPTINIDRL